MAETRQVKTPLESTSKNGEPFLNKYFKATIKMQVSDLHLKAESPPHVRVRGDWKPLTGGPLAAGQDFALTVAYTKADPRTTAEILGIEPPGPDAGSDSDGGMPLWVMLLIAAAAGLAAVAVAAYLRTRSQLSQAAARPATTAPGGRRNRRGARQGEEDPGAGAYCRQCGEELLSNDRFCAKCGTPVKGGGGRGGRRRNR